MRLYEYEAKQLYKEFKLPVPESIITANIDEAGSASANIGLPVVLKAQVLTGGRGKVGGIKLADVEGQVKSLANDIFNLKIKDFPVEKILVEKALDIKQEIYLGITLNRIDYKITIIACGEGGIDIEEIAQKTPEKIFKLEFDIDEQLHDFQAMQLAKNIGLPSKNIRQFAAIALGLFRFYKAYDCKLAEINPLVLTANKELICADARVSLDDDALFRHPDLAERGIEKRHEEGELTPREKQAREWGIPYLDLDGDIGMFPGGAGYGIMGNDFITYFGGKPANFMDSGGGPSPERIAKMLVLLDENPNVKAIFGARFGGISRCDDFAKGVIIFLKEHGLSKPIVMRMTGNMWEEGVRLFEEAKKESPELFAKIEFHGIEEPIENIAKRAVQLAKEA
ncbi:MAG: acetate--CoA ligase family protein [candidate division Zixibacteria bacterium]|nr:acetate--CoA ligase family protein [candidate division Zixibacteria bacterium]